MRWLTLQTTSQTIVLAALFLVIAVATALLACGPVAQPAPADEVALPAAQDGGDSEEPTEEPTVEPTDTPVPNSTECVSIPPKYQATPELAEGQVRVDGIKYQCFVVTPTPTPKYPELGDLNWIAVAGEEAEAQRAASQSGGASGASGQVEIDVPIAYVVITTSSNTADVVSWLQGKGLPLPQDRVASDKIYISSYRVDWELGDDFIYAYVPASLLVPLSKQTGVARIDRAERGPYPD